MPHTLPLYSGTDLMDTTLMEPLSIPAPSVRLVFVRRVDVQEAEYFRLQFLCLT